MYASKLNALGLEIPEVQLPTDLKPVSWGQGARTWVFFFDNPTADQLQVHLEQVRGFVNAQYTLPRPLRFRAPYMVVVGVLDAPQPDVDEVVRSSRTSTGWGGEVYHLVSVTRSTGAVVVPTPQGTQAQRRVERLRLESFDPARYARVALG